MVHVFLSLSLKNRIRNISPIIIVFKNVCLILLLFVKVWDLATNNVGWIGAACRATMVGHLHTVRCLQVQCILLYTCMNQHCVDRGTKLKCINHLHSLHVHVHVYTIDFCLLL